eukprot:2289041-Alexandrium_andersonii.AAC.1
MEWLDRIIDQLGLADDFKRGVGPPSGIDSRLALRDDITMCAALQGTRWWVDMPAVSGEAFPDLQASVDAASKPKAKPAVSAFADGSRWSKALDVAREALGRMKKGDSS